MLATWVAFTLRLDTPNWPNGIEWVAYIAAPVLSVPIFAKFGLYRAIYRYTGIAAIITIGKAVATYCLVLTPVVLLLFLWDGIPRSLSVLQPLVLLILVASSRAVGWRWLTGSGAGSARRLLIYGAGGAGAQTAAALAGTQQYALLGFLDDDAGKVGRSINGVTVFAPSEAAEIVARFGASDILLALPSASRERRNQIIAQLQSLPVRIRSLPGLADLASGRVTVDDFRDLDVEDLLCREPVAPRPDLLSHTLRNRVVLVTGAGGSIGSELSRQIVLESPSELLLLEHSEYALYRIHQELTALLSRRGLRVRLHPILADVCNFERVHAVCATHHPSLVYHAAAYKHVPMVESNPGAGIINNVLGTMNMARAAMMTGVERFVLISTDKAVRPTNVMGASKRMAELVLQALAAEEESPFINEAHDSPPWVAHARTCFSIVRFGNVLGSSGSVVPLFRAQIAEGGPLTITHPEITRYFMTIPEAAQLVLHAGALAQRGDLFVLDMGAPIKILDLAKRMVALSGRTVRDDARPTGDICITFTGLRPGEKLFEELLIGENPLPTEHPRIVRAREDFMSWPMLTGYLQNLLSAARNDNVTEVKDMLRILVPGYTPEAALIE
jgi:FlaA1/EpsC-like NDP-sugar epimerase